MTTDEKLKIAVDGLEAADDRMAAGEYKEAWDVIQQTIFETGGGDAKVNQPSTAEPQPQVREGEREGDVDWECIKQVRDSDMASVRFRNIAAALLQSKVRQNILETSRMALAALAEDQGKQITKLKARQDHIQDQLNHHFGGAHPRIEARLDKYQKQRDELQDFVFNEIIPLPEFRALKDRMDELKKWACQQDDEYDALEKELKGAKPELPEMLDDRKIDELEPPESDTEALNEYATVDEFYLNTAHHRKPDRPIYGKPEPPESEWICPRCKVSFKEVSPPHTCIPPPELDSPQPGDLCWFGKWVGQYEPAYQGQFERCVHQDEIRELRIAKDALGKIENYHDAYEDETAQKALDQIGDRVRITRRNNE